MDRRSIMAMARFRLLTTTNSLCNSLCNSQCNSQCNSLCSSRCSSRCNSRCNSLCTTLPWIVARLMARRRPCRDRRHHCPMETGAHICLCHTRSLTLATPKIARAVTSAAVTRTSLITPAACRLRRPPATRNPPTTIRDTIAVPRKVVVLRLMARHRMCPRHQGLRVATAATRRILPLHLLLLWVTSMLIQ